MTSLPVLRKLILAVLLFGTSGALVELILLSHYEDAYHIIPLGLLALALAVTLWHSLGPRAANVRALQAVMALFLCAGVAGMAFHFNGAAEFQLEMDPSQSRWALVSKVLRVHAPPLLAPGLMIQLGLIGLVYTYRHPATTGGGLHSTE